MVRKTWNQASEEDKKQFEHSSQKMKPSRHPKKNNAQPCGWEAGMAFKRRILTNWAYRSRQRHKARSSNSFWLCLISWVQHVSFGREVQWSSFENWTRIWKGLKYQRHKSDWSACQDPTSAKLSHGVMSELFVNRLSVQADQVEQNCIWLKFSLRCEPAFQSSLSTIGRWKNLSWSRWCLYNHQILSLVRGHRETNPSTGRRDLSPNLFSRHGWLSEPRWTKWCQIFVVKL